MSADFQLSLFENDKPCITKLEKCHVTATIKRFKKMVNNNMLITCTMAIGLSHRWYLVRNAVLVELQFASIKSPSWTTLSLVNTSLNINLRRSNMRIQRMMTKERQQQWDDNDGIVTKQCMCLHMDANTCTTDLFSNCESQRQHTQRNMFKHMTLTFQ